MVALVLERYNAGKDTFLSAESTAVSLADGVTTDVLKFRTGKRPSILKFILMIDSQLTAAGDIITINWLRNGQSMQKYAWKQISAAEIIAPITFTGVYDGNTELELEVNWNTAGLVPAITCNGTAYGQVLREGSNLY